MLIVMSTDEPGATRGSEPVESPDGPDPSAAHQRSVALIRRMDDGDIQGVGTLLGELGGPEEFAAQVVSLASLARLLLDQLPTTDDAARVAVLDELARVLVAAERTE